MSPQPPLTASTDPLDQPLEGQDEFFLEQTKKKGVKVREFISRASSELGVRGWAHRDAVLEPEHPRTVNAQAGARPRASLLPPREEAERWDVFWGDEGNLRREIRCCKWVGALGW